MTTPRTVLIVVAGLLAGAIGFYAGLFVLLAITGLDSPSWAPVAQLTGSALFIAAAVSMTAGLSKERAVALTLALTAIAAIVGALLLVAVATLGARILTASNADHSRSSSHAGTRAG